MARLTNRPSVASSRYLSATPDTQFDQENMDPEASHDKDKARATTNRPLQDTQPSKRRRLTPPSGSTQRKDVDAIFTKYYDPDQPAEERREVKRRLRELEQDFQENRDELLRGDAGERLTETVKKADRIFKQVKQTADATPDSRLLVNVGDLAYKKSGTLTGDASTNLDVEEFITKAISFMRVSNDASQQDDEDEQDTRLDWDYLGRHACYRYNSRPPVPSFLLGPLSREKKIRLQTQRRPREKPDNIRETNPTQLRNEDIEHETNSLTAECQKMRKHLKKRIRESARAVSAAGIDTDNVDTPAALAVLKENHIREVRGEVGVPLFEYVINPRSFGQTIENLFHVSFLIKEGSVGVTIDQEGLPVLHTSNPHTIEEQQEEEHAKHQSVLSIDFDTWQALIQAYDIQEPMIPHREEQQSTQPGVGGWYS